jgi:hypothetical protein
MIGKERIAIMVKLLCAFDAMADIILNKEEIPTEPRKIIRKKSERLETIFPMNKE